ncbi:MAG: FGGY-family carbohydrate kinase [Pseudotabrizicola sp.]|uniref:FGGY-family carbohydrate kinase n=1 Tax=Pseudotabrizicola sp. TaxID=2939647 RepID=UPI00273023B8|nr:FGGY-family carbohydrate kinase [Pseudotabrizicola sp.]MDP2082540.1 FGGY-family carbohydrate kinase [Pseudotabrizicola sp.]MDZ7573949.1 FGGY-family carbohydrate kinase [Pseudotabrizicola sp.]
MTHAAIIDIGKTNVKLALVDLATLTEVAVRTAPNRVLPGPPWPHFHTDGQWAFLRGALTELATSHGIDAICVTTHGACAALLDGNGALAAPVLDYEHAGPDTTRDAYDQIRPSFSETGSPKLPLGLNLGAQLFWQLREDPTLRDRIRHVLMWPQYWGHKLTGQIASDICSLGCHTDLWAPMTHGFSTLPAALGLAEKMAPARAPGDVLGTLLPDLQATLGIGPVAVLCGLHDSNASLLPHLLGRQAPFAVVSTGTWVVSMAVGGHPVTLDPSRDTLINVNAFGDAVPSARFMGGREYDLVQSGKPAVAGVADADQVLAKRVMLLPSVVPESGPFQGMPHRWANDPMTDPQREVALGYYLALMTAESLAAIGADGPSIIEGPFASNPWFCTMLHAATGRSVLSSSMRTGTAVGAAMLFARPKATADDRGAMMPDPRLAAYARVWRTLAGARQPDAS